MNAQKDFSKQIIKNLAKKGIVIIGSTYLPDTNGNFLNGETGYKINDNGTSKIKTYAEIRTLGEIK